MERIICLAAGYLCGLFQTGYIYGKLHGIDIRSYGSGNSGSTNALRVMGKKAGLTVLEVTHQGEWVSVTARKDF